MTYKEFKDLHFEIDYETGNPILKNLVIKNVKVGKEALNTARLFKLNPSTLMFKSGESLSGMTHGEEFITFVNQHNKSYTLTFYEEFSVPAYYYDDTIRDYVNRIRREYQTDNINDTSDVDAMYKAFGMEVNDD